MRVLSNDSWTRRGFTLLWGSRALGEAIKPEEAVTLRQFVRLSQAWPEELPSVDGNALVVVGLEGALDCLTPQDAEEWLESTVRNLLMSFQKAYEGDAALILWLPSAARRVRGTSQDRYTWECGPPHNQIQLPLGRLIWAGAESDVRRVLDPAEKNQDADGPAWIGLHHPRLS